jgi:heme/copper-type cytochrome/quinol oxidase subunit 1
MTTIDTSPDALAPSRERAASGSFLATVAAWLITSDHKRVGRLFVGGALLGLVGTVVVNVLLGVERIAGDDTVLDSGAITQLFQAQRVGLVFGALVPFGLGLAIAAVPLQVGARSLAFPRAALAGFYGWLAGLALVIVALANNGGIGGGDADMVDLFLAGHALLALGLLLAAGTVATTVLSTRAPGMNLRRVPMFAWAAFAGSIGMVIVLPVLIGTIVYLFVAHTYGVDTFGGGAGIGLWIGWVFSQPTTFVFALPAIGVFSEMAPVTFRRRQPVRDGVLTGLSLVLVAALAAITQQDVHNLPWPGSGLDLDDLGDKAQDLLPFALFNLLPLLGATIVLLLGLANAVKGKPKLASPFVFAFFGIGMILVGMIGNVLHAVDDLGLQGTVFEEGAVVYVAYGAALAAMGGIVFWAPKLWGRRISERKVLPLALLGVLATVLAALPYYIAGFADQPAGVVSYDYSGPSETWNILSLVGHGLMGLVVLAFVGLALAELRGGADPDVGDDPWGAHTIEWSTTSPAPGNNFPEVPTVRSPEPMLDLQAASQERPS